MLPYSMAKSGSSFLGQGLNIELKVKVDVLSWECGMVQTKLLEPVQRKRGIPIPTAVKGMLKDIGSLDYTHGAF